MERGRGSEVGRGWGCLGGGQEEEFISQGHHRSVLKPGKLLTTHQLLPSVAVSSRSPVDRSQLVTYLLYLSSYLQM